jgi:anti-sigma B factor antagonist
MARDGPLSLPAGADDEGRRLVQIVRRGAVDEPAGGLARWLAFATDLHARAVQAIPTHARSASGWCLPGSYAGCFQADAARTASPSRRRAGRQPSRMRSMPEIADSGRAIAHRCAHAVAADAGQPDDLIPSSDPLPLSKVPFVTTHNICMACLCLFKSSRRLSLAAVPSHHGCRASRSRCSALPPALAPPPAQTPTGPSRAIRVLRGRWAPVPGIRSPLMINGLPVVTAPADIDATAAEQLRVVLLRATARSPAAVVVDLTRTRFCDSAGLTVLVRAHRRAVADGGELRLILPAGGAVPRIFAITRLDRVIPVFGSLDEALAPRPGAVIRPLQPPAARRRARQLGQGV